jgi:hypothetical protein
VGSLAPRLVLALALAAGSLAAPAAAPAAVLFSDSFAGPGGLIANEWAHWNDGGVESPLWDMTSGSLFGRAGAGWTGVPDDCAPDRTSSSCTNSAVFRLNTRRFDFSAVRVEVGLRANAWTSTASTPAVAWDGVHLWLRYVDEEELYYASVNRRDGAVVVKKKCRGGPSNGGTYVTLASRSGHGVPLDAWQRVGASVEDTVDGSVAIEVLREGAAVLRAVDTGAGCAPIRRAGAVGVRGDNLDFELRDFTVSEPHPAPAEGSDPLAGAGPVDSAPQPAAGDPSAAEGSDPSAADFRLRAPRVWRRGRALRLRVAPPGRPRFVALLLDGRRVAIDRRAPFVLRYRPSRRLQPGLHRLQAVTSDGRRSSTATVRYLRPLAARPRRPPGRAARA